MDKPLVSFIIAAYNEEKYIVECINSCLNQTYENIEVIITNDGSTDKTVDVINELFGNNHAVKVFSFSQNRGKVAAFNNSYRNAKGQFIAIIGADDINYPERIETQLQYMQHYDLVCSSFNIVNSDNSQILVYHGSNKFFGLNQNREFMMQELLDKTYTNGNTILMSQNLASRIFPLPESLAYEDRWIGFIASYYTKVFFINENLVRYRAHTDNASNIGAALTQNISMEKWLKNILRDQTYYEQVYQFINEKKLDEYLPFVTDYLSMLESIQENKILQDFIVKQQDHIQRFNGYYNFLNLWLKKINSGKKVIDFFNMENIHSIAVYGYGEMGQRLIEELNKYDYKVQYIIDKDCVIEDGKSHIIRPDDVVKQKPVDVIIVTPIYAYENIKKNLKEKVSKETCIMSLDEIIKRL